MVDKNIAFRLWNDGDEDQILALIRLEYGDVVTSYADYFDWQYRRNPAGRAAICCAQLVDGTLVSIYSAIPIPVIFNGTAMTASLSLNTLTHPDFRGHGLFPKCATVVYEALKEAGNAFTYGFPNPNSYPGFTRKLAFADIGRACLLIRPHDPIALLSTRFPMPRWFGFCGVDRVLLQCISRRPKRKVTVKVKSSFEGLPLAHLHEEAKLVVDANIEWLTWRYLQVPRRRYYVAIAGNPFRSFGIAVYQITSWDDVRIGTVNELFLTPDCNLHVVESLMYHVFNECEVAGCAATLSLVSPASRKLKMLKRAGFWVVPSRFEPQPFPVIIKEHTVSVADIRVADMDVSFGIYDIF